MNRRDLLSRAAALAAQLAFLPARAKTSRSRVRPHEPGWPSPADWARLKESVGGGLIPVPPLLADCQRDQDSTACKEALKSLSNPLYIGDQPAGTQVSGWLDGWSSEPSVYAVKARSANDVVAAVNFARRRNLRLVVKGGAHSYQGTSNAPDSLLIWTRGMNKIVLHDAFVPKGRQGVGEPRPAVTVESGAMWIDIYNAVTTRAGRYVQGGGCTTVGVAGLVQSGGFGSFSKGFGSAASSLLEADIVTADGRLRTVNASSDSDLFWALKGGGGGSWGVVTRLTLKTHELPQYLGGASGKIKARSDAAFARLIGKMVDFYADHLFNPHWGEQLGFGLDNSVEISMVCQGLRTQEAAAVWAPLFEWIRSDPELTVTDELGAGAGAARGWWDVAARKKRHNNSMISDPRPGVPEHRAWWSGDQDQVGIVLYGYESAWLPASLLHSDQRARLAQALFQATRHYSLGLHFNKGLAGAPPEALKAATDTATNPEVIDAFALAIIADGGAPIYAGLPTGKLDTAAGRTVAKDVAKAMAELKKVAPGAGSYVSESNYFERDWQRSHWGSNYQRLRKIKDRYDPECLFYVHHGVGTEGWSDDGFVKQAPVSGRPE